MPFTMQLTTLYSIAESTTFGVGGRTLTYLPLTIRLTAADRHQAQRHILGADLSAQQLTLTPLGVSAPVALMVFATDQPVDVRLGLASAPIISAVRQMILGANISSIWVTTGSIVTKILLEMAGGSGATLDASIPFP